MTMPASGTISMSQINTELGRSSTASISLDTAENGGYATINTNSSSRPSATNPASMSEWYSYNHSAAPAKSVTFSNLMSIGYSGTITGTVTIVGAVATFSCYSTLYGTGRLSTNLNIGGTTRATIRSSAGTTTSTTFTLSPGTYSYTLDVTVTSGSGSGGINYTQ